MVFFDDLDVVALAFAAFNILRLASYFPQIIAVARDQNGATAISFSCCRSGSAPMRVRGCTLGSSSQTRALHSSAGSMPSAVSSFYSWRLTNGV